MRLTGKAIKTVILVILAFCVLWMQPPFQPEEYETYLPNLDHKLTTSPIGRYYNTLKSYLSNTLLTPFVYDKFLVMNPIVDEHCIVHIAAAQYYMAPIKCDNKSLAIIEKTISSYVGKTVYFKQAPGLENYRNSLDLPTEVKIGYFWSDKPDSMNLAKNSINLYVAHNKGISIIVIPEDTLWEEIQK